MGDPLEPGLDDRTPMMGIMGMMLLG
jgi:hypothetical protein